MSYIDWAVLIITLLTIVGYGVYKSSGAKSMDAYLLGNHLHFVFKYTTLATLKFPGKPGVL